MYPIIYISIRVRVDFILLLLSWLSDQYPLPILIIILVLLPTEFLRASSAQHGTPMDLPKSVRGLTYGREGRISRRRCQSNKYSVGASTKFVIPYINIPQYCHFVAFATSV